MPAPMKKARLTIGGIRVGDVIDITPSQSIEEEDTSVIDRAEDDYAPRIDVEEGSAELTCNIYVDLTDPGQQLLSLGAKNLEAVLTPMGIETGMLRQTYAACIVTQYDLNTIAYKGRLKRTFKMKANGGMVEDTIPA